MCELPTLTSFTCITQHPAFRVYAFQTSFCLQCYLISLYSLENQRAEKCKFQKLLAATNRADSQSLCKHLYFALPPKVNLQMLSLLSWAPAEQGLLTATSPPLLVQ